MSIPPLSDSEFERYSRQIMLSEWGEEGQSRLKQAKVLIVGCGGLGTAASLYLAGAGVGNLVLADDDAVERSNLSRQVAYREGNLGESKARALSAQLMALNTLIQCRAVERYLVDRALDLEVSLADVVLDCSDNMATRQAVNEVCRKSCTPLVAGAAIGWQGQLMVFDFAASISPCYHCLFPASKDASPRNCQSAGVVGPVAGVIGNLQALEALKLLTQTKSIPSRFYQLDGQSLSLRAMSIPIDSDCAVCHPHNSSHVSEVPDEHLA
ncbi:molybdopterin-synthase adenylyltransferase MoeB [Enterovibrio norvegicus FF-162]|uniref:Molybdopterin-synthase adenylyltransferase MoeB n=1 Tax=Enterovibrio norvegicus FF-454 TaxID=1185651 RepID=A0A1E5CDG4_9GAMM|nr:HesA/MoeB/ThiF family protein [Enterovibrio norvegicus]OEE63563.1 molybdopterin-synthase adenylyltransferase MoeB [Enterovibrio norvegicus FF-454]OEE87719.1 molybdopterin-synthase adenylyltransferase MoeB [Enterovibrio norvegicus FF-162]